MKKLFVFLFFFAGIYNQIFADTMSQPSISGDFVLCDSAIYSLQNVPNNATIEWSYIRPSNIPISSTPLRIGSGQGTKNVYFKRGTSIQNGIGIGQPINPWIPVAQTYASLPTVVPYEGFVTIKATVTFNNTTYTLTKEIYMPEKVEIDDQGMGLDNPWIAGTTKVITLESPLNSTIREDIKWEVDMVGGTHFTVIGGGEIGITPSLTVTTITIRATYLEGCGDENQTCVKTFPVVRRQTLSFVNPASGNVEINVLNEGATDSNMRTINNQDPYMGAYSLELWHDLYGKVREMDVTENTPTVTMNLDGLNNGIYVLRLIIDNQIVAAEQMIIK